MKKPAGTIHDRAVALGRSRESFRWVTADMVALAVEERFKYIETHLMRMQIEINEIKNQMEVQ
jgi:hypothetical protein